MTAILGISAYYHDSAAALIVDGVIKAAAQEERFTRIKHDAQFPQHAVEYVLAHAQLSLSDIDYVVFYDKPFLKFERLVETFVAVSPKGLRQFLMGMPVWLREKLFLKNMLMDTLKDMDPDFDDPKKLMFCEHHMSHAASAFYPSPFASSAVLTLDGVGEWATTTLALGEGNKLDMIREIQFPHSLGLLYSAFTYYLGFRVNSGEYKVMGLAPYGEPKYQDLIFDHLIDVKDDGSFWLDQSYFSYAHGLTMTNKKFASLFGQPVRQPDSDAVTQFHMDIAASIQAVTTQIMLKIGTAIAKEHNAENLCLAGGVALNCVANGELLRADLFKNIWIQPAAGDAGGAIGAALTVWHQELSNERVLDQTDETTQSSDGMSGAYLGPSYTQQDVEQRLEACGAVFEVLSYDDMIETTAKAIADGKAIGWHQGRMEFGPRALGARSILADPRSQTMQSNLNLKVKFREGFRPFAPAILREDIAEWFDLDTDSPYMLFVANVAEQHLKPVDDKLQGFDRLKAPHSDVPAITHVDGSARIQTVDQKTNPAFHALISRFKALTGCPILVNTSFNVRGEPIVATPEDAFNCFMATDIDLLVVGNAVLSKEGQRAELKRDYREQFSLD